MTDSLAVPVHEFGHAIAVSSLLPDGEAYAHREVQRHIDAVQHDLSWIRDLEWVDPPRIVEGPPAAFIRTSRNFGWYGRIASQGYEDLRHHFSCRKQHIPERIDMAFIGRIIEQYAYQQNEVLDNDDDD